MNKLIISVLSLLAFAASATQADLRAYMATGKDYLDRSNIGWKMQADGKVCEAMKAVGLGCSYNDRAALVDFLHNNGKVLFPCKGGTNPYTVDMCNRQDADLYNYIGQPIQNQMLAKAIVANKELFKDGNLTAKKAKKWKM